MSGDCQDQNDSTLSKPMHQKSAPKHIYLEQTYAPQGVYQEQSSAPKVQVVYPEQNEICSG